MPCLLQLGTLVAFLNIAYVTCAVLGNPALGGQTSSTPLNNFNFLLTFGETVQAGTGSVQVKVNAVGGASHSSISCTNVAYSTIAGKYGVLPYKSTELGSNTQYKIAVPSACFKNVGGETLSADVSTFTFTSITKGTAATTYDITQPSHISLNFLTPQDDAWVTSTEKFVMYFDEAVQMGDSPITIMQEGTASTVHDSSPTVEFDAAIPGKVTVKSTTAFVAGHGYKLKFNTGAFQDVAQNCMKDLSTAVKSGTYMVKVTAKSSTSFVQYPLPGTVNNVTKYENMVFDFGSNPVVASSSAPLKLCKSWSPTDACATSDDIPSSDMIFLGSKIIINPTSDFGSTTTGQQYNVSIPDTGPFTYYNGLSASETRSWTYTFRVEPSTNAQGADTLKPPLIAAFVDCDGDGDVTDSCTVGGATHTDLTSTVDASKPMLTTAQFKLYFREKVTVVAGKRATLVTDDATTSTITPTVGSGVSDCVVTVPPASLTQGKLYTLTMASGVLVDSSVHKNVYDGTTFSFYTPFNAPTASDPSNGEEHVPVTATVKLTFGAVPRLGTTTSNQAVILTEKGGAAQSISLTDPDRVKFQGTEILIIPENNLGIEKQYSVRLPKKSIRYMTSDFSFDFSTRAADTTKPKMVLSKPSGSTNKLSLDAVAPYVWLSEAVVNGKGKSITISDGGSTKYSIISSDICTSSDTAGTTANACVEFGTIANRENKKNRDVSKR